MERKNFLVLMLVLVSISFTSCSKDEDGDISPSITPSITPSSISMYYNSTYQLNGSNVVTWESSNEFVATVDSKGLVRGGHVGTTTISASNGKNTATCNVTIIPKVILYDDPILEWGVSKSTIISKESHSLKSSSSSAMLAYDYSIGGNSCLLTYNFTNEKLSRIDVYLDLLSFTIAGNHLVERFSPLSIVGDIVMYSDGYTKDKTTTIVGLQTANVSGTELTYISYIPSKE